MRVKVEFVFDIREGEDPVAAAEDRIHTIFSNGESIEDYASIEVLEDD